MCPERRFCALRPNKIKQKSDTVTINVNADTPQIIDVESVTIEGDSEITLKVNDTHKFTVIIAPENATNKTIVWSIEDGATAAEAQINQDGEFSAGSVPGTAVVRAQWEGDENVYDTVTVTVLPVVESVQFLGDKERAVLAGQDVTLSFVSEPEGLDADNFTLEVIETDLDQDEYVLDNNVFRTAENTSGYAVIKVYYNADPAIYDTVVINVNYNILKKHNVKFYKEDGVTLIYETTVIHGMAAPNVNYYVLGYDVTWDKPLENITQDTEFVALLTPIEYTVIYYKETGDGEYQAIEIDGKTEQKVAFGEQATPPAPEDYQVEGKLFFNWRIEKEGNTFKLYAEYLDIQDDTQSA